LMPQRVEAQPPQQGIPPDAPAPIAVDEGSANQFPIDRQGPTTKIYGGTDAAPNSYYWHAGLVYNINHDYPFCGGTLIATEWVLTAAHCIDMAEADPTHRPIQFVLGARDRTQTSSSNYQYKNVLSITKHPLYNNGGSYWYDIALIKIEPAQLTSSVGPIGIQTGADAWPPIGTAGVILGWGLTTDACNGPLATILQQANVTVQDYSNPRPEAIHLAGGPGVHPCSGDSGGSFSYRKLVNCPRGYPTFQQCYSRRIGGVESSYFFYIRTSTLNISSWICTNTNSIVEGCNGR
jgi:hypothetical protein